MSSLLRTLYRFRDSLFLFSCFQYIQTWIAVVLFQPSLISLSVDHKIITYGRYFAHPIQHIVTLYCRLHRGCYASFCKLTFIDLNCQPLLSTIFYHNSKTTCNSDRVERPRVFIYKFQKLMTETKTKKLASSILRERSNPSLNAITCCLRLKRDTPILPKTCHLLLIRAYQKYTRTLRYYDLPKHFSKYFIILLWVVYRNNYLVYCFNKRWVKTCLPWYQSTTTHWISKQTS